jgi:hypothetical protein
MSTTVVTPYREAPISWAAISAGAVATVSVSVILTMLAAGFGLTVGFAGFASHRSLGAFTPVLGATAIVIQVIAAAFGGYIAGRLRGHWALAHLDEAHFRDTAHGLIAWATANLAGLVLAALVLTPYADALAQQAALAGAAPSAADAVRAENIAAQAWLFMGVGMLLSAFIAAVAARLGGLQAEEMHLRAVDQAAAGASIASLP